MSRSRPETAHVSEFSSKIYQILLLYFKYFSTSEYLKIFVGDAYTVCRFALKRLCRDIDVYLVLAYKMDWGGGCEETFSHEFFQKY